MAYHTSISTFATAFPAPPTMSESRIGSEGGQQGRASHGAEEWSKIWKPYAASAVGARGHGRSASMGGFGAADREAVRLKRYSVYIPDDLTLPHDLLPSPPTTPPGEEPATRKLSYQPHSTTTKHPFPSAPSSFTLANRRRSLANVTLPLSPPSVPVNDQAPPTVFSSSDTIPESRSPTYAPHRPLPRPTPSASTSASTLQSQRSTPSKIKRKPVPHFEEDMDVVDDPLWDPTKAGGSKEGKVKDSTGVEGQLRRLSVEERNAVHAELHSSSITESAPESGARSTKPLPRTKRAADLAPQRFPPVCDMAPAAQRSGFTFDAPLPGVLNPFMVEDRGSATKSRVSSVSNERLSVDMDNHSLRSSSSCAGATSTIATSPSLDNWTPSISSGSSQPAPSQSKFPTKRVLRPFALLRRKQSTFNISLDSISAPHEVQAPAKTLKQEDELDRWMNIMGDGEDGEEEEGPAPRAVSRPFCTLTAAERAARAASRLSILGVQSFRTTHFRKEDDPSLVSPLVFSVPPLVYSSSSLSSSRDGFSISSRPRTLEEPPFRPMRHGMSINAEGSEESGLNGEDELSLEGDDGSNGSLDEFVDARSSRRPSSSSTVSDGSLVEIIGMEPRSEGLDTMMEVDEPPTPNPNHSSHATPKIIRPPSPFTSDTATMAAPTSLFSSFSWSDAPSPTQASTPPITFLAPSDSGHSSSRPASPETNLKTRPIEGKRRTSLTPRPPKPPKSPRRGSKASSGASSSIDNVLETFSDAVVDEKIRLATC